MPVPQTAGLGRRRQSASTEGRTAHRSEPAASACRYPRQEYAKIADEEAFVASDALSDNARGRRCRCSACVACGRRQRRRSAGCCSSHVQASARVPSRRRAGRAGIRCRLHVAAVNRQGRCRRSRAATRWNGVDAHRQVVCQGDVRCCAASGDAGVCGSAGYVCPAGQLLFPECVGRISLGLAWGWHGVSDRRKTGCGTNAVHQRFRSR